MAVSLSDFTISHCGEIIISPLFVLNINHFLYCLKSATPFPKCYLHKEEWTFDS